MCFEYFQCANKCTARGKQNAWNEILALFPPHTSAIFLTHFIIIKINAKTSQILGTVILLMHFFYQYFDFNQQNVVLIFQFHRNSNIHLFFFSSILLSNCIGIDIYGFNENCIEWNIAAMWNVNCRWFVVVLINGKIILTLLWSNLAGLHYSCISNHFLLVIIDVP